MKTSASEKPRRMWFGGRHRRRGGGRATSSIHSLGAFRLRPSRHGGTDCGGQVDIWHSLPACLRLPAQQQAGASTHRQADGQAGGHRAEEIRKLAAYRIARVLHLFSKPDGGLSYSPKCCCGNSGFDMSPAISQSDAIALNVLAGGINVCVDLLGIGGSTSWTGKWRVRMRESESVRQSLLDRLPCFQAK